MNNFRGGFLRAIITIIFIGAFSVLAFGTSFTVTNTNDSGPGSLRQAILDVNALPGPLIGQSFTHIITFNIPGTGVKTISPLSELPTIDLPTRTTLHIWGGSQPGFSGTPLIEISGANAGTGADGFRINNGIVQFENLAINRFGQNGIRAENSFSGQSSQVGLKVYGCFIGTNPAGTVDLGNGEAGILAALQFGDLVTGVSHIGGTGTNERNVISGNKYGIIADVGEAYDPVLYIRNNHIGTSASGTGDLGNDLEGIRITELSSGSGEIIIGGGTGEGNVISGNNGDGIFADNYNHLEIKGNFIGIDRFGSAALGNGGNGIHLDKDDVIIGNLNTGERNVISANGGSGIKIEEYNPDADQRITIRNNYIGTDWLGNNDLGNTLNGIHTLEDVLIGGDDSYEANIIGGNNASGILVQGTKAEIYGNRIGVTVNNTARGNSASGITLLNADEVRIGQANVAGAANIIGANGAHGIALVSSGSGSTVSNEIYNNLIGVGSNGAALGNVFDGVRLSGSVRDNYIGKDVPGSGNTIANNGGNGINLLSSADGTPTGNTFSRNLIYSNSLLGIDLKNDGVTPNDAGDGDSGPNDLQNYPVISGAYPGQIGGTVNGFGTFRVEFYRVDSCDSSGYGEGKQYLGSTSVSSSPDGNANFLVTNLPIQLLTGQIITATATRIDFGANATSEFSQCRTVQASSPGNLSFSAPSFTVGEGDGTATVTVQRTGSSTGAISVAYRTITGSALVGQDYTNTTGTLNFASNQTTATFTVPIIDDTRDESDGQGFQVALSSPTGGALLVDPSIALVTITDNDAPPTVSISDVSASEGNEGTTTFTFTVSSSEISEKLISMQWTTANGTAQAPLDYQQDSNQVFLGLGAQTGYISVTVNGDLVQEIDETFIVNLSNPTNATVLDGQGIATILDEDRPGKFSFALSPYNANEESGARTVTVQRTNGSAGAVSVDYATGGGTATPGADYVPTSGTLVFNDGETQKTFSVTINEDATTEPTETINLSLFGAVSGTLGNPTTATINILDNDSGSLLSIKGTIKKPDNTPLAGATVTLQDGTSTRTFTTDSLGDYEIEELAPNGNYAVTPSSLGYTFEPIALTFPNLSANVINANFTATPAPSRQLRVVGGESIPGQTAQANVEMVAQGDENSVGFSLNFNPTLVSNPQVQLLDDTLNASLTVNSSQAASGRLGILLALPANQAFAAGTRQLVKITFTAANTTVFSMPVSFGDAPLGREIVNTNADPLQSNYVPGTILFAQGFEADVAPRPTGTGNGSVTIADFTQIGRYVAGLDTMDARYNEFQRADSAPRISKGNGALTVSDYTQAGRYAAGLDPVVTAGGLTAPLTFAETVELLTAERENQAEKSPEKSLVQGVRAVRVVNAQASPGNQVTVTIQTDAEGDENGFGFSLNYDPAKLSAPLVQLGADAQGATLIPNVTQTGKVGVVLGLPAGQMMPAGTRQLVTVRFNVAPNAPAGQTPLSFGDAPVFREVVNPNADVLATAFTDGAVTILGPTSANVKVSGRVATVSGQGIRGAIVTLTDAAGAMRTTVTGSFGYYQFEEVESGGIYTLGVESKRFTFTNPTRILPVTDDVKDADFTADEQ